MRDHVQHALYYFEIHLLFASLVWVAAWALCTIRSVSSSTKYWIWIAASLNFVLPVGALIDAFWGPRITWAAPLGVIGGFAADLLDNRSIAASLATIWLLGSAVMAVRLFARIRSDQAIARLDQRPSAQSGFLSHGVKVSFTCSGRAPAVAGLLHPHILLPQGIDRLLSRRELDAVLAHELTHARRHDNLIRLLYEIALCLVWFHPLLWISGTRLALYRELSCDESVIRDAGGQYLLSALAKLVGAQPSPLLLAAASSHLSHRLALLSAGRPHSGWRAANALSAASFGIVLLAGIFCTIAHTACCFAAHG